MKTVAIFLQIVLSPVVPGRIDSVCRTYCQDLAVQGGLVRFMNQAPPVPRNLIIGNYLPRDQRFVPRTEAPIRDLHSPRGWHIVVSAFLHHDAENEGEPGLRVRFLDPRGAEQDKEDVLMTLDQVEVGQLFGGNDEILAITSEEEHAYNVETDIWFLPEQGKPKSLLSVQGTFENFVRSGVGRTPGVMIARETYDGEHADTKGTVPEFYTWDPSTKSLKLQKP